MQEKNQTFRTFLERTDRLAERLGCQVQELPEVIGISRSSLFAFRSGKSKISEKTWRKLEASESKAGIIRGYEMPGFSATRPVLVREPEARGRSDLETRVADLEEKVRDLSDVIEALRNSLLFQSGKKPRY